MVIEPRQHDALSRTGSGSSDGGGGGRASPRRASELFREPVSIPRSDTSSRVKVVPMSVQPGCHAAALATRGGEVKRRGKRKPYTQELNARSTRPKKPLHHKHSNKHGHENIHSLKINITKPTVREPMAKGAVRDPQLQHFNRDRPARDIPGNQPPPSPLFQKQNTKTPDRNDGKYPTQSLNSHMPSTD